MLRVLKEDDMNRLILAVCIAVFLSALVVAAGEPFLHDDRDARRIYNQMPNTPFCHNVEKEITTEHKDIVCRDDNWDYKKYVHVASATDVVCHGEIEWECYKISPSTVSISQYILHVSPWEPLICTKWLGFRKDGIVVWRGRE